MGKRKNREACYMGLLPYDLKLKIIENLSGKDILRLACVSTEWRQLVPPDNGFWKNMCYSDKKWKKTWKKLFSGSYFGSICRASFLCPSSWKEMHERGEWIEKPEEWKSWKELFSLWKIVGRKKDLYKLCLYARQLYDDIDCFSSVINFAHRFRDVRKSELSRELFKVKFDLFRKIVNEGRGSN